MKKLYFGTICLPPPIMVGVYFAVFLGGLSLPSWLLPAYTVYFWFGLVVLLIDLWRSSLDLGKKVLWTVLNLMLGLILLPTYWVLFILRSKTEKMA